MTDLFSLSGETAVVTGGASGIGRTIARGLAEAGVDVALLDLPGSDLEGAAQEVHALGQRALPLPLDVTEPDHLEQAMTAAERELGAVSLAVNCAGIANAAPAEEMPAEQWRKVIDINMSGLFFSCQAEGRRMLGHGRGSIVNIASMSGAIVNRGLLQAHYNSSKAGVAHLSKSLAMEWVERGVRVNALSPGYVATPMNTRPEVADQVQQFEYETPMQRMAQPEELVGPTVFLLSGAASYCTGVDLLVDGGFTCW